MPHVGHADSVMNNKRGSWSDISDWSSSKPRHSSHKGNITKPLLFIYIIIYTSIHVFIPYTHAPRTILPELPGGSGAKASHMRLNASQCSVLCHEVAVASFNMSNDRPGFEGRPTKGLRLPRVKQSQGRKRRGAPSGPRPVCPEADRVISTFSFDPKSLPNP